MRTRHVFVSHVTKQHVNKKKAIKSESRPSNYVSLGPNDELIFNCPPAEGTLFIPCCDNITYETVFMTYQMLILSIMLIVAVIIAK